MRPARSQYLSDRPPALSIRNRASEEQFVSRGGVRGREPGYPVGNWSVLTAGARGIAQARFGYRRRRQTALLPEICSVRPSRLVFASGSKFTSRPRANTPPSRRKELHLWSLCGRRVPQK